MIRFASIYNKIQVSLTNKYIQFRGKYYQYNYFANGVESCFLFYINNKLSLILTFTHKMSFRLNTFVSI